MTGEELQSLFSSTEGRFQLLKQETWPGQARSILAQRGNVACTETEKGILDEIQSISEMRSDDSSATTQENRGTKSELTN